MSRESWSWETIIQITRSRCKHFSNIVCSLICTVTAIYAHLTNKNVSCCPLRRFLHCTLINKQNNDHPAFYTVIIYWCLCVCDDSLAEMEALLNEQAFESETQLQTANSEIDRLKKALADRERQLVTSPSQGIMIVILVWPSLYCYSPVDTNLYRF